MRITQLQLAGFKSFPHKTVLEFPRGVSGVVGPNGCGKSNIVDAIRWVLGEQSPKHLRGDAMEAVIFNGNERLAPLGMAEVALTFENDGSRPVPDALDLELSTLPAFVRDLGEIEIARRYYRSGESEYFINKTPCRLKDVTELFLGTGVGAKAYGIIEQGRVDQLVNAKPEERRLFIEEAAGTTLYRSRKLAAERKMERARENLARVNDILAEISRQMHYLERQAKRAEEYRRLQEQMRELELQVAGSQWRQLGREQQGLESRRQQLLDAEAALRRQLGEWEQAVQAAASVAAAAEQRHAHVRERLAVLDAERESAREKLQLLERERDERSRRRERLGIEIEHADATRAELGGALEHAEQERAQAVVVLADDERELAGSAAELGTARTAVTDAQERLEVGKGALVDHITREVEMRNALAALERRREEAARQLDKRRAEAEGIDRRLQDIAAQCSVHEHSLRAVREQLSAATGEKESRARELQGLAEVRRRWERELATLEAAAMQTRSRLESLEQIQRNYEGFQRGVRAIMRAEQHADGVVGVVAEVLDPPAEYERAVAAVLGERLQYVIVRSEEAAASAVDLLRQQASGRGSFIPMQPRLPKLSAAASTNGSSKRLLDLIRVDEQFRAVAESLLGDVVVVPDLRSALALWQQNGIRITLVTPQGDVIDPCGVITGGSDRPIEEEILSRRREMEVLRAAAAVADGQVEVIRAELQQVAQAMAGAEASLKALDEGTHALTLQIVTTEKDLERLQLEQPQCSSRREVIRYEIESAVADDRGAAAEMDERHQRLAELTAEHQRHEQEAEVLRHSATRAAEEVERLSAVLTGVKVRVAERRERQHAALAAAEAARGQLNDLARRAGQLRADLDATERERAELDEAVGAARAQETAQAAHRMELEGEVGRGAEAARRLADVHREEEQRGRALQAELESLRAARSEIEVQRSEIRLRLEHLVVTMREKYGIELEGEPHSTEEPAPGANERLEGLRLRVGRLGDVNVGAIDELRELGERRAAMEAQRDDLASALGHLERTIQKLNRASRTRFAETFAKANEIFQQVFPRLFRGGEGRLVLTDENNLLETGVDIVVRPPGKRLDSVALLSGGERALVAVSLIFSLFLINPTPFCVLDEVDAPLDDANVGRFNQMVKEMSAHSQFIIITHNKRTMESADVLYGVTMQEPGVSKVISVAMI